MDSFSTDGTVDYLQRNLEHPRVRFLSHPPGLYASWNHAISKVETEFVYISTTGDTITREGIELLLKSVDRLECDVVISKPIFRNLDGSQAKDTQWPIDHALRALHVTCPRKLSQLEAITFTISHPESAFLGSVASNIFRTSTLKRFPFPTEFGTAGDGAWGWMNAGGVSFAILPERFSSFLLHPSAASTEERQALQESRRCDEVLRSAVPEWQLRPQDLSQVNRLLGVLTPYLDAKIAFDKDRRARFPWWLNPLAWLHRWKRNHARDQLKILKP